MKFHHIGIYSKNLNSSIREYKKLYKNLNTSKKFYDKNFKVWIIFIKNEKNIIYEIIEPKNKNKNIFSSMKNSNFSIHHLAYSVNDIEKETKRLENLGYIKITKVNYAVALKTNVTFLINKLNIIIELIEGESTIKFSKI